MPELKEGEEITIGGIFTRGTKSLKEWIVGKDLKLTPKNGELHDFDWPEGSRQERYSMVYNGVNDG